MRIDPKSIFIEDFSYELPNHKIAEFPLAERDQSRLLIYQDGKLKDEKFNQLISYLPPDTTLVFNDTHVIEARLLFQKSSGGMIEIFCLEPYRESIEISLAKTEKVQWLCLIGGASKWKHGQVLEKKIQSGNQEYLLSATYIAKEAESFIIEFSWKPGGVSFAEILHKAGAIPLPPYIKRSAEQIDSERYQTIFSRHQGSVAAPTAALHFSHSIFQQLAEKNINTEFITLHVGAGTFKPVKTVSIDGHHMHREPFTVKKELLQKLINADTIIAVGTTSLRTIESIYWIGLKLIRNANDTWSLGQWEAYELEDEENKIDYRISLSALIEWMDKEELEELDCNTSLIIVPGYEFRIPSALITNFHQPQSTLLLLVAAFIGDDWKMVYEHALQNDYRFLSYGDSSLLWKNTRV